MFRILRLLPILLSFLPFVAAAQAGERTETILVTLKILKVEKSKPGTLTVAFDHGADFGLKTEQSGEVWGILRPAVPKHNIKLGTAVLKKVTQHEATAEIATDMNVLAGDLLFINVIIPWHAFRSTYFYLASYGTIILDPKGQPYYSFDDLIRNDSYALRSELFSQMKNAINASGAELEKAGSKEKVEAGPGAGKFVWEVLKQADTLAVWYYAYDMSQRYMETMGQTEKLLEGFYVYAKEGDRASSTVLKNLFLDNKRDTWDKHFADYKRKLTSTVATKWQNEAVELRDKQDYAGALKLHEMSIYVAGKNTSEEVLGECILARGETYSVMNEPARASEDFAKARESFVSAKYIFGIVKSDHALANYKKSLNKLAEALVLAKQADANLKELLKKDPENDDQNVELYQLTKTIALIYSDQKDFKNALATYEHNLILTKQKGWTVGEAITNWLEANIFDDQGRYSESLPYYTNAATLYLANKDTSKVLDITNSKGIVYENLKRYNDAMAEFRYGLSLSVSSATLLNKARLLRSMARTERKLGLYDKAIANIDRAVAIYASLNQKLSQSYAIRDLGSAYEDQKKWVLSAKVQQARIALVSEESASSKGDVFWDIAYAQLEAKEFTNSILNYRKAEALYTQVADTSELKKIICNIGNAYVQASDSVNAYKEFKRAVNLTLNSSDQYNVAYVYTKLGGAYGTFGNFSKKIEYLQKEYSIYLKLGDENKCGEVSKAIGKVYEEKRKDYAAANPYYIRAIAHYRKGTDKAELAQSASAYSFNVGWNQKEFAKAIPLYEEGYRLFMLVNDSSNASILRSNIGQNYWSLKNFDKAIEAHEEAIKLASLCKNQEMIYKSWNVLATLYNETHNPVKGSDALINSINALELLHDSTRLSTAYSDIATSLATTQDYAKSFEYYAKAIKMKKALKDTAGWASALFSWAGKYQAKNEPVPAMEKYNESLVLYRAINDLSGEIYCLANMGSMDLGFAVDYKKAEARLNEAVKLAQKAKDDYILAFCYDRLKGLYRKMGQIDRSEESIKKALELYKKSGRWKDVANTLAQIAYDAFYVRADLAGAMKYYDQAMAIADTLNDQTVLAGIYQGRGDVYEEMGEFPKALEMVEKGLVLYTEVKNEWGIAGIYIDKGNIYKHLSEYALAMDFQQKADSLYVKMGTEYSRLAPLANLGENYVAQGDYPKGLEYTSKSLAIMQKAGDEDENVCIIKGNIGEIYYLQNNFPEAERWLEEALKLSRKIGAKRPALGILSILGRVKIEQGKYQEAEVYLNEGVKESRIAGSKISYLSNLVLKGKLEVEQKHFENAKGPLEESYRLSKDIGKDNIMWESRYLLGVLYKNTGDLQKSKEYLKESIAIIEKIRNKVVGGEESRKLFSSDKHIIKAYSSLIEVLLELGETEEAMTYLQKNNEDNLKAKFKGLDIKFENADKTKAVNGERSLKAKLDGIEQQIAREKTSTEIQNTEKLKNLEGIKTIAESEYLKFVNQQINVQPELSKYFNNSIQPTQFRKIKKQIPADMALVSYLAAENQLYIFAATRDTVIAKIVTVSRDQLNKDVNAMLNVVKSSLGTFGKLNLKSETSERQTIVMDMKQTDKMVKPFEEGYHYLIAPISGVIAGKSKLCIIPTGSLNYIPFQLLTKTMPNGDLSLLMNQFSIFYANSTDMLFRDMAEATKSYSILAFGNPDKSLPSTEKEVNDIKKMFPSASVYLRDDATEDKVKNASEKFNVIHFATHGSLDYEDFSKSFLTMAANDLKNEDGRLTLEELWGMDAMTHLSIVVLSACQTAVTKGSNESSPVSPASGFLQNGVKSVVASLWKVDDEATSLLMTDFYKNIKTMDAITALRTAQISLASNTKFTHPYYWAAFVLLGDWR